MHTATDPLLYDITWHMLHCWEPSPVLEKAESEGGEGAGTAFLTLILKEQGRIPSLPTPRDWRSWQETQDSV